jgi:hypothetical protein
MPFKHLGVTTCPYLFANVRDTFQMTTMQLDIEQEFIDIFHDWEDKSHWKANNEEKSASNGTPMTEH